MPCRQCCGLEELFDRRLAQKELKRYLKKGPSRTTRLLLEAIQKWNVTGKTLLDVGGGVGAIQHELLKAGASAAFDVDGSTAYIDVARQEAERRGNAGRTHFYHGDFVDLASEIPRTDIVTLDRMICCYPDARTVLRLAADKAESLVGLVYPRDTLLMKAATPVMNWLFALRRSAFRLFAHSTRLVTSTIEQAGFQRAFFKKTLLWQVVLYRRDSSGTIDNGRSGGSNG